MEIWQAIIQGLVQGLTEFLPVSSKSHLVFTNYFMHLRLSETDTVFFDVMLHWGTLVAVVAYFYQDLWLLLRGAGQLAIRPKEAWTKNPNSRLFVLLMLGTVPAGLVYLQFKDFLEAAFENVPSTAAMLLVTAAMLLWISRRKTGERTIAHATWKDALLIGLLQACALLPGISRSGTTITGGLLRGLDRESAPRFSFLLSVPVILAAGVIKFAHVQHLGGTSISTAALVSGLLMAAVSGYFAVGLLVRMVQRNRLDRFAYYCLVVGIGMLTYWTLLVPKVSALNIQSQQVTNPYVAFHADSRGVYGPIELGQQVIITLDVKQGMVPVEQVTAMLPAGTLGHVDMQQTTFSRTAGTNQFVSEKYRVLPIGDRYEPRAAGDLRDVWVVLRNKWGIENQVRVRLRIVPESAQSRMA